VSSSEPPAGRGVDEWKEKNLARVDYQGRQLTVYRSGWLLGPAGLPAAISRYKRGEATPEQVARAYVRSRVTEPEAFVFKDDELGDLLSLVASCSRGPELPGENPQVLADALAKAQDDADRRLRENMQAASEAVTKVPKAIAETADRIRSLVAPVFNLLDQNPALKRALLGPAATPEFGLPGSSAGAQAARREAQRWHREAGLRHAGRARENFAQAQALSRPLQDQFMVYNDVAARFGATLTALQAQKVRVPPSLERLRDPEQHTGPRLREAAVDTVPLAQGQGDQASAQLLTDALKLAGDEPDSGVTEQEYESFLARLTTYVQENHERILVEVVVMLVCWAAVAPPPVRPAATACRRRQYQAAVGRSAARPVSTTFTRAPRRWTAWIGPQSGTRAWSASTTRRARRPLPGRAATSRPP
jgi:hypothetical protein